LIKSAGTWSSLSDMDSENLMDVLYLLIPLSVILVFFILGGLWWAIYRGQFEDIESEGERILKDS
jgi:cbb3-type cytochrome oxidase maturation protein